jgi:hypothetical protein
MSHRVAPGSPEGKLRDMRSCILAGQRIPETAALIRATCQASKVAKWNAA